MYGILSKNKELRRFSIFLWFQGVKCQKGELSPPKQSDLPLIKVPKGDVRLRKGQKGDLPPYKKVKIIHLGTKISNFEEIKKIGQTAFKCV